MVSFIRYKDGFWTVYKQVKSSGKEQFTKNNKKNYNKIKGKGKAEASN